MAKVVKENEVHVTYEDQQKINKFARVNARLQDVREDLDSKKKELENLEDAENEILMLDSDNPIPYMVGEVFIHCSQEDTGKMLDDAKSQIQKEIEAMQGKCEAHKKVLTDLKVQLYAKFGNNINLEAEEES